MNTEIATINDIERMSQLVVKSGLFGIKTPDQAMSLMLINSASFADVEISIATRCSFASITDLSGV